MRLNLHHKPFRSAGGNPEAKGRKPCGMNKTDFSVLESQMLGFRFGRCNAAMAVPEELRDGIAQHQLDVLRLRVPASDSSVISNLEQTGFPYFFAGGIRRYRVNCLEAPLPDFTSPDIHFELFEGQEMEQLKLIMKESWGNYPLGYYRTPVLRDFISKELESDCLFQFYAERNNHLHYPDNYLWFVKQGETYIGFIALYVYAGQDMVDSTIAGFRTSWQGKGLFPNILRHIRAFCRQKGITYFCCGARNENVFSQWAFERDYMKGEGVEYVYHVLPMLREIDRNFSPLSELECKALLWKWAGEERHQFTTRSLSNLPSVAASGISTIQHSGQAVMQVLTLPEMGTRVYSIPKTSW